jgi:hypothetical protein
MKYTDIRQHVQITSTKSWIFSKRKFLKAVRLPMTG